MFLNLALLLFWPILQGSPQYVELSKYWKTGATIETGFKRPLAAVTCPPVDSANGGWLIAVDSSGAMLEMRYDGTRWSTLRSFSAGAALQRVCTGAPYSNLVFHLYAATKTGSILEFSRGTMGWSKREIVQLTPPIKALAASEAGYGVPSLIYVADGNGKLRQLVPPADTGTAASRGARWTSRSMPDMPGGVSQIATNHYGMNQWVVAAGPKGDIYRYVLDSLQAWHADPWAKMPAGPKDIAASTDPTLKDIAVYYSGTDGLFRFLFLNYTDDKKARVPAGDGVTYLIGAGTQRRFNEFFGVSGSDFSLFEFNFEDKAWHNIPIAKIDLPVVSTTFGFGFNDPMAEMFVACANGKIQEFVRYKN